MLCVADGRKFGFGFVQFNSLRNAMKAVEFMNGKEILGEIFTFFGRFKFLTLFSY